MRIKRLLIIIFIFACNSAYSQELSEADSGFTALEGPYLGQKTPGKIPKIFAKGVVSTNKNEHSPAIFSKDGTELYWSYYDQGHHIIMTMKQVNEKWTKPMRFFKNDTLKIGNPFFSSDFEKLFFFSDRDGQRKDGSIDYNFWYVEKQNLKWCDPKMFNSPPNNDMLQLNGCLTSKNLYFTSKNDEHSAEFQLYISSFNGESWEDAKLMSEIFNESKVNWTPYVSPDETYMIFSSDRENNGKGYDACDLFISFKNSENDWNKPINMGKHINSNKIERFPWVSPDGKYLFFVRGFGDIYWVSTKIIEKLKTDNQNLK